VNLKVQREWAAIELLQTF